MTRLTPFAALALLVACSAPSEGYAPPDPVQEAPSSAGTASSSSQPASGGSQAVAGSGGSGGAPVAAGGGGSPSSGGSPSAGGSTVAAGGSSAGGSSPGGSPGTVGGPSSGGAGMAGSAGSPAGGNPGTDVGGGGSPAGGVPGAGAGGFPEGGSSGNAGAPACVSDRPRCDDAFTQDACQNSEDPAQKAAYAALCSWTTSPPGSPVGPHAANVIWAQAWKSGIAYCSGDEVVVLAPEPPGPYPNHFMAYEADVYVCASAALCALRGKPGPGAGDAWKLALDPKTFDPAILCLAPW